MNTTHKILAEKYQAIIEQTGEPKMKQDARGNKYWYLNDKRHRIDGPAVEWADGNKEWWLNGERHRVDGPAIEDANGYKEWWLNDKEYTEIEFWEHTPLRKEIEDLFR